MTQVSADPIRMTGLESKYNGDQYDLINKPGILLVMKHIFILLMLLGSNSFAENATTQPLFKQGKGYYETLKDKDKPNTKPNSEELKAAAKIFSVKKCTYVLPETRIVKITGRSSCNVDTFVCMAKLKCDDKNDEINVGCPAIKERCPENAGECFELSTVASVSLGKEAVGNENYAQGLLQLKRESGVK